MFSDDETWGWEGGEGLAYVGIGGGHCGVEAGGGEERERAEWEAREGLHARVWVQEKEKEKEKERIEKIQYLGQVLWGYYLEL